jgi:ornithine carbamoyltransferase
MKKRDFLKLADLSHAEHKALRARARELKGLRQKRALVKTLEGRTLGLVFEKASTRTRVSFEAAMCQLGGSALSLPMAESQIKRGETIEDTARVLSRYVDGLVFRTFGDARLQAFAEAASVPVINGLSEGAHPVQLLADLMTVEERFGSLEGRRAAFVGDGASNMALSWIEAANLFQFPLTVVAPKGYQPPASLGARVTDDAKAGVLDADVVVTDVWMSMGQEDEAAKRQAAFAGFQLDETLLQRASPKAIVLHCLPAHRGEEISAGVLEGPQSVVFDEAENRLHAQKALLEILIG